MAAALAAGLLLAARGSPAPFPTRAGETGLLDVPDAEVVGLGAGLLGVELRFDHSLGQPNDLGPLPISAVAGMTQRLDLGFAMREWGQPGDDRPAKMTFGTAAKLQLVPPADRFPGIAAGLVGDRLNHGAVFGARIIASTFRARLIRFVGFAGAERAPLGNGVRFGATVGGAVSVVHRSGAEAVIEALTGPRGADLGLAFRWALRPSFGISLGTNYLPSEHGLRVSLGIGFGPPGGKPQDEAQTVEASPAQTAPAPASEPIFTDERPHFRLTIHSRIAAAGGPRHAQYAQSAERAQPAQPAQPVQLPQPEVSAPPAAAKSEGPPPASSGPAPSPVSAAANTEPPPARTVASDRAVEVRSDAPPKQSPEQVVRFRPSGAPARTKRATNANFVRRCFGCHHEAGQGCSVVHAALTQRCDKCHGISGRTPGAICPGVVRK